MALACDDELRDRMRYDQMHNEHVSHALYLSIGQLLADTPQIDMTTVSSRDWERMADHNEAVRLIERALDQVERHYN